METNNKHADKITNQNKHHSPNNRSPFLRETHGKCEDSVISIFVPFFTRDQQRGKKEIKEGIIWNAGSNQMR